MQTPQKPSPGLLSSIRAHVERRRCLKAYAVANPRCLLSIHPAASTYHQHVSKQLYVQHVAAKKQHIAAIDTHLLPLPSRVQPLRTIPG